MKQIEIRDLSSDPDQVTVDDLDQSPGLEDPDRPEKRRPATAWKFRDLVGLWIYFTIIGPQSQQPENDLALTRCKAEFPDHKRPDLLVSLVKYADRYTSASG